MGVFTLVVQLSWFLYDLYFPNERTEHPKLCDGLNAFVVQYMRKYDGILPAENNL